MTELEQTAQPSDDDFEDSRFYGNEGDGVQYATVDEINRPGDGDGAGDVSQPVTTAVSDKDRKKELKRLEKEQKEREKREKKLLKEQERQIKEEAKVQKSASVKRANSKAKGDKGTSATAATAKKTEERSRNVVSCRVHLLDGTDYEFQVKKSAKGQLVLDMVYEYVNLLEREFFSCYFMRDSTRFWLIADRKIATQIGKLPWEFHFGVKFYSPEPAKLTEDITRYQMCLQLRQDIMSGRLPCSVVTNALLGACTVQAELGDYDPSEYGEGIDYLQEFEFCPDQTPELLLKIAQIHRTFRGQTPEDAELNFLENVKKLELYGVELQNAKDAELVNISIGVSAIGIVIYRDQVRVNRFPWPVVLKMAYKSDKFYLKIRPAERETYITTIVFKMANHDIAKRFWRLAVEHHTFFRLKQPVNTERSMFSRFGSQQSFSGRTYYQSRIYASSVQRQAPYFERASSRQLTMGSSFMDESSRFGRKKTTDGFDTNENLAGHYEQVAVVAGSGPAANRVAFVKTIRPGEDADEETERPDDSLDVSQRYQQSRDRDTVAMVHHASPDSSFSQSTEGGARGHGPAVAQKKKTTTETKINVFTEHKSEKNGVVETKIERRVITGRVDVDHDVELSRAIHSAMDMSADLSVDKIEINPSDIAHSMVGADDGQKIEIAPVNTKKSKKRNKDKA